MLHAAAAARAGHSHRKARAAAHTCPTSAAASAAYHLIYSDECHRTRAAVPPLSISMHRLVLGEHAQLAANAQPQACIPGRIVAGNCHMLSRCRRDDHGLHPLLPLSECSRPQVQACCQAEKNGTPKQGKRVAAVTGSTRSQCQGWRAAIAMNHMSHDVT
jgi:hypothetical protein